jgi:hypothetical protein
VDVDEDEGAIWPTRSEGEGRGGGEVWKGLVKTLRRDFMVDDGSGLGR